MLNVFFTVDVEIWCNGWHDIDARFPAAFRNYVHGEGALRYKLQRLQEHGLHGVFFVEPLFSTRFGQGPLDEIVGLIREHGQEVQQHLHTEWVCESHVPLIAQAKPRRQFLRQFSLEEQTTIIGAGKALLERAGGGEINAFRAGSFGFNRDSLTALAANGIAFDSSYNCTMFGPDSGVSPGEQLFDVVQCDGVFEYPMSVFNDGTGKLRHVQLGACSNHELEGLMRQALRQGRQSFMMLSHNFELLNAARNRPDPIMIRRFARFCRFMADHRGQFRMRGFHDLAPAAVTVQPPVLTSPLWKTGHRIAQQALRRRYG
ncbi:polysaccharide deacetylase family protein [Herbaspirillum robiniae]|uniref:polysaccharide deacetylase family protein n=1 Tax=Herbaspirillum robiniae TaxID=2014887 RepID=UPI003D78992F